MDSSEFSGTIINLAASNSAPAIRCRHFCLDLLLGVFLVRPLPPSTVDAMNRELSAAANDDEVLRGMLAG